MLQDFLWCPGSSKWQGLSCPHKFEGLWITNIKRTFPFPGLKLEASVSPGEPVFRVTTTVQGKVGSDCWEVLKAAFGVRFSPGNGEVLLSLPLPLP